MVMMTTILHNIEHLLLISKVFLLMPHSIRYGPVSLTVCVSITSWYCIKTASHIKPVLETEASTHCPTQCYKEIQTHVQIEKLPSIEVGPTALS